MWAPKLIPLKPHECYNFPDSCRDGKDSQEPTPGGTQRHYASWSSAKLGNFSHAVTVFTEEKTMAVAVG